MHSELGKFACSLNLGLHDSAATLNVSIFFYVCINANFVYLVLTYVLN